MATTPTTGTWFPNFNGLNVPRQVSHGISQAYSLVYSLRDTVSQLSNKVAKLASNGTHLERLQTDTANGFPEGSLYFEIDRTGIIYQARMSDMSSNLQWFYASGIMTALAANRPTDLGHLDTGFLFLATDSGAFSLWNGTAWVGV